MHKIVQKFLRLPSIWTGSQRGSHKSFDTSCSEVRTSLLHSKSPIQRIAKRSEGAIVFTNTNIQDAPCLHNRPLYVEARVNGLKVKRALVDNGASVNLMPITMYTAMKPPKGGLVSQSITLTGFAATSIKTMGYVTVELEVGPIWSPTRFHVYEADTSYRLLLGRQWIHTHNCVPSTLHQCVKAYVRGNDIHIPATIAPLARDEAYMAEAMFFDEVSEHGFEMITRPWAVRLPSWEEYELEDKPPVTGPKSRKQIERGTLPNRKKARWCAGPAKMLEPTIAMVEGEEVKTAPAQLPDRSKPQINILEEVNLSKNPEEKRYVFISSDLLLNENVNPSIYCTDIKMCLHRHIKQCPG